MDDYRLLTDEEIGVLEDNGCRAEDWTSVNVAEDFKPAYLKDVQFYGEVYLGVFDKNVEVSPGFIKHSGICHATLRNVTVGDNCLIEHVMGHINNYVIGEDCRISNVGVMETLDEATFGEGNTISVLNEAGSGNVVLFAGLTSNVAALMVKYAADKELFAAIRRMVRRDIERRMPETGTVGNGARILNTMKVVNTNVGAGCWIDGARSLIDCTLTAEPGDGVYVGSGVICENTIVADGSEVTDNARVENCYVGEASKLTSGFTAENSLFFANTFMAAGEACAAFCGPFSASHHKSTLLIGCQLSFYNAGSATNYSNHAYKMGPLHYGTLLRGSKTASGAHLLLPATIGAFSVCLGKLTNHPDTTDLPFSYLIADAKGTFIVPGRNLITSGLYRDVNKWRRRDMREPQSRKSVVNDEWLNPFTVGAVCRGIALLEQLRQEQGADAECYTFQGCCITAKALRRGLQLYRMAVDMFIAQQLPSLHAEGNAATKGVGAWSDLSGLLLPEAEEQSMVYEIRGGYIDDVQLLQARMKTAGQRYRQFAAAWVQSLIHQRLRKQDITAADFDDLQQRGEAAHAEWVNLIKADAEKEFALGDVDRAVLDNFVVE